jgi:hypothetical protein
MKTLHFRRCRQCALIALSALALVEAETVRALEVKQLAGAAHAFPVMLDLHGKKLGNGEFTQELQDGLLRIRITYELNKGGRIEEKATLQQSPELVQKSWSLREMNGEELQRSYVVDFDSGKATARKREKEGLKDWSKQLEIDPGRTFAGFGVVLALQNLRDRLVKGEAIELKAVGFTPEPRVVGVKVTYQGVNRLSMSGRTLRGEKFQVQPQIPAIAKLFIKVPDTLIWLTSPPSGFLRSESPLGEPSDPLIRVDLASGGESGPAEAVKEK